MKKPDREKRTKQTKRANGLKWLVITALLAGVIIGGISLLNKGASAIKLKHIHGLGYSPDGAKLIVPAHDGIRIYDNGSWSVPPGDQNDYMGFSAVDDGFYSSGHPGQGSSLSNPLGIIKSNDTGKTISVLALEEESDFHGMSVGYKTHIIYAFNAAPNSKMSSPGLFYSKDEGQTWAKSESFGVEGEPAALAVHPEKENVIALGTQTGVFLSDDYGQRFEKIVPDLQVTALYFNLQGNLLVGGYVQSPVLQLVDTKSKAISTFPIPELDDDAIAYIAQNPVMPNEFTFATAQRDIYITRDDGVSWLKIANQGKALDGQ
ncbi:F510_1955 family glycosylhydrolase [Paenibacillus sp. MMO-177]|uniref:F510_1955 family glycosylhydrolase n=1 Tax=Paenibacillus sp. MMO-177 TaxID=3081289 RepID=UPI003019D3AE